MKSIIILVLLSVVYSVSAKADDLCKNWKPELKERRDESRFTKESYLAALKALKKYAQSPNVDPWQFIVVLNGYLLKEQALYEIKINKDGPGMRAFCEFVVQQGVHRG